jgi:hypothetical protein
MPFPFCYSTLRIQIRIHNIYNGVHSTLYKFIYDDSYVHSQYTAALSIIYLLQVFHKRKTKIVFQICLNYFAYYDVCVRVICTA